MTNAYRLETTLAMSALAVLGSLQGVPPRQATNRCAGQAACAEVPTFLATVTEVRAGVGTPRTITLTIRFTNKTPRPLVVGYADASGSATDERGNRLLVVSTAVRGIGIISRSGFDPKLTLQPGESGEAGFEFAASAGQGGDISGAWDVEFTIREIDPVANHQYKLGKEHLLQFRGLRAAGGSPD